MYNIIIKLELMSSVYDFTDTQQTLKQTHYAHTKLVDLYPCAVIIYIYFWSSSSMLSVDVSLLTAIKHQLKQTLIDN